MIHSFLEAALYGGAMPWRESAPIVDLPPFSPPTWPATAA
jgi:hypothetical protein